MSRTDDLESSQHWLPFIRHPTRTYGQDSPIYPLTSQGSSWCVLCLNFIALSNVHGTTSHRGATTMQSTSLSQKQKDCIDACFACAQICETCADDMIGMKQHDDDLMARCTRLCRDCSDICVLAGRWISRNSPRFEALCQLCAEICDECAEVCERHAPHHALCGPCAEQCRRCADVCREMVESGVHSKA